MSIASTASRRYPGSDARRAWRASSCSPAPGCAGIVTANHHETRRVRLSASRAASRRRSRPRLLRRRRENPGRRTKPCPLLNFRMLKPTALIDINAIPGLDGIRRRSGGLRIGAPTRHFALETSPACASAFPVLSAAMAHVGTSGDPQPRHHRRQPVACRSGRRNYR